MSMKTQFLFMIADTKSKDEKILMELEKSVDGENVEIRTDPNGFTYEYEYYEDDESDGEEQFKISFTKKIF